MTQRTSLKVKGMTCTHCKATVEKSLSEGTGVSRVEVDLKDGKVEVYYDADKVGDEALKKKAVEDAGYEVKA